MLSSFPAALVQARPDVVVGTSPQLLTVVSAWAAARMKGARFVFELRDLWPESMEAVGAASGGPFMRGLATLAHFLYRRADCIVSVTRSFVSVLEGRGIATEQITVVRNGVNLDEFAPAERDDSFRRELGVDSDGFLVTYVGTLGMAHGLKSVVATAAITREEPIHFLMVGDGAERQELEAEVERLGLDNVTFLGGQPRERIPCMLNASDVVLVPLRDDPLFSTVIPSKIFEAMAVGKPIILAVRGESADIVDGSGAGLVVTPESPEEMADAILRLTANPELARSLGANGRRAAEEEFCRRAAARRMMGVLERVVAGQCGLPDADLSS
jgi:glycosyltransferase involved in cell wall biosynthesis